MSPVRTEAAARVEWQAEAAKARSAAAESNAWDGTTYALLFISAHLILSYSHYIS